MKTKAMTISEIETISKRGKLEALREAAGRELDLARDELAVMVHTKIREEDRACLCRAMLRTKAALAIMEAIEGGL